ncbi:MAG: hypothetical protein AB7P69_17760 [Candidatus Binatia bacterium]
MKAAVLKACWIDWPTIERSVGPGTMLRIEGPSRIGALSVVRRFEIGAFSYLHDGFGFSVSIGRYVSIGRQLNVL